MILAYCRVSTMEQAEGTSLEDQERKAKAIATLRNAGPYEFSVYCDEGVSGSVKLHERPEGKRLLLDMKPGDVIVASKLDRLFRNAADALTTAEYLKKQDIQLVLTDMGVDSVTGNGVARLFFGMLALVAEFERERINERTHDGRKAKKQKNGHNGGPPPFGFKVIGEGKEARLEACAEETTMMTEISRLMREHTPASAAREAERMGLRSRTGKPFQITQLQRIASRVEH